MNKFVMTTAATALLAGAVIGTVQTADAATKKVPVTIKQVDSRTKKVVKTYKVSVTANKKTTIKFKNVTGYKLVKTSQAVTAKKATTITVNAKPNQYVVTYKYVNKTDGTTVTKAKTEKRYYNETVTAKPTKVTGYTAPASQKFTVKAKATKTFKYTIPTTGKVYPATTKGYVRQNGYTPDGYYIGYSRTTNGKYVLLMADNTYRISDTDFFGVSGNPSAIDNFVLGNLSNTTFAWKDATHITIRAKQPENKEWRYITLSKAVSQTQFNSLVAKYHVNDAKATLTSVQAFMSNFSIKIFAATPYVNNLRTDIKGIAIGGYFNGRGQWVELLANGTTTIVDSWLSLNGGADYLGTFVWVNSKTIKLYGSPYISGYTDKSVLTFTLSTSITQTQFNALAKQYKIPTPIISDDDWYDGVHYHTPDQYGNATLEDTQAFLKALKIQKYTVKKAE